MNTRSNFAAEVLSEKRKVFQWMRKWLREDGSNEKNVASFDLSDLIILHQCAGFTLHKFQNADELIYTNPTALIGDTIKIELNCSKSGMRAEMLKPLQTCNCPQNDDIKTEEFFSVTSCTPATKGNLDVSLSSFLPTITHPKQNVVGDIFKELIAIIKNENETDETDAQDVRTTIERMSLDPTKSLMQNLKDIKRVVDSFLGDRERSEESSCLRNNLENKTAKTEAVSVEKTKTRTPKPISNNVKLNSSVKGGVVKGGNAKNKLVVGSETKETGAAKKRSPGAVSGNKINNKLTKVTSAVQKKGVAPGSASGVVNNKFDRVTRSKIVNKK